MGERRKTPRDPRRRGLTLVELLVAMSIIGVLVALVLPAVQAAREAAHRVRCVANLRQIGLALTAYEGGYGTFPPGQFSFTRVGGLATQNHLSPIVHLLPFLDFRPLYDSINMDWNNYDEPDHPLMENRTARGSRLSLLLCPSDGEPYHANSYRFNVGTRRGRDAGQLLDGPFGLGIVIRSKLVRDGLSNTAFVSEGIGGSYDPTRPDRSRDMKLPVDRPDSMPWPDDVYIEYCQQAPAKGWLCFGGRYWMYWGSTFTAYNHNGSPNDLRTTCGGHLFGLLPPRSYHGDSVNVLYGDGHVRPVQRTVEKRVWHSQGTHAAAD